MNIYITYYINTRVYRVVCRQLGFDDGRSHSYAHFGAGTGAINLDDVRCGGSEASLIDCSHTTSHNCGHHEDAGVTCWNNPSPMPGAPAPAPASSCTEGNVRLVGGTGVSSGRVEVFMGGRWGTVCDDAFDSNDARLIFLKIIMYRPINADICLSHSI